VRLTPKGGRNRVEGWAKDASGAFHLKVRVSAPPHDGEANAALLSVLAEFFGVSRSAVTILGGQTARVKMLEIKGEPAAFRARLQALGDAK
jgi:uncharacterized protein (TIGR00251 family)